MTQWFYPGQEDYINKLNDLAAIAELSVGPKGDTGDPGPAGMSAYEEALANGFVGTEAEWLASLVSAAHVGSGGAAHANAVASGAAGFMTGADKTKLDGIATGANNYTHPANHPPSIITQDASNRFVTDAEKTVWNAKEPAISAGTTAQYRRGDKTWQPVADLPVSTAQAAAIATATAIHPFLLIGA